MSQGQFFESLEEELMFSLNPVEPRQEFVSRLKQRLITPSNVKVEMSSRSQRILPVAAGLFGGIILIWTIKRFIDYLVRRV
jgi:hypothetical protein